MEKPEDSLKYITWWNANFDDQIDLIKATKTYDYVSNLVRSVFERSNEYQSLIRELSNYDVDYKLRYGYDLLMKEPSKIELKLKDWPNFISKVWRKNVVQNNNWNIENWNVNDCAPENGWIMPSNWFERIHDIVRTKIVVRYFDGVEWLLNKMCSHFNTCGCHIDPDWEAREEGYYAAHLNVISNYDILEGISTRQHKISVEIQITTQMKDIIADLTHKYYERRRENLIPPSKKWQWNYESEEFSPNYIGHMLHYIEGTVIQIRNKEMERTRGKK